jgi:HEPN domain-containing protein
VNVAELSKSRLIELADAKLEDARFLLSHDRPGNAYYLAGYAVELLFKAVLSSRFRADTIPSRELVREIFTHDLTKLLNLADLRQDLADLQDADPQFRGRWEVVLRWKESSRYETRDTNEAAELLDAIDDSRHGVLRWLKTML